MVAIIIIMMAAVIITLIVAEILTMMAEVIIIIMAAVIILMMTAVYDCGGNHNDWCFVALRLYQTRLGSSTRR